MITKTILLFIIWIGLTNSFQIQQLILGIILSFIVSKFFISDTKVDIIILIKKYLRFIPFFLKELVKANIEVAKIVLSKKIDIDPAILKLKTDLRDDYDKLLLSNSITLTPGTITLDIKNEDIFVHILDLKGKSKEYWQDEIVEKSEKIIKTSV